MTLVLKLEWAWGGSKIVTAHNTDPLSDVLSLHGFTGIPGTELFIAHRGRLLSSSFSLSFHEIQNGDRVICYMKKLPTNEKSRKFLESLIPSRHVATQIFPAADTSETNRRTQNARMDDLAFSSWESQADCGKMMADLLQEQEEQSQEKATPEDEFELDLTDATEISDLPLPSLLRSDGFGQTNWAKGTRGWRSGYVADVAEQPRRGNFFDHLKK
jgi:hypothetical protein